MTHRSLSVKKQHLANNQKVVLRPEFWLHYTLEELNTDEWEALCDGCGRCCLMKLEDVDDPHEPIEFTRIGCQLLSQKTGHCSDYSKRHQKVPDCIQLTPQLARSLRWLPSTCAYGLMARGQPLPEWHPLLTGQLNSVKKAGMSVAGKVINEALVHEDDWEEYVVKWVVAIDGVV